MSTDDRYTSTDWLWELIDTGLYLAHLALVVLLTASAIACPVLLWLLLSEAREIRAAIPAACECRHHLRDDDGPGPVLPRVLPRVRRIGEGSE
jgi:hypothetical protein